MYEIAMKVASLESFLQLVEAAMARGAVITHAGDAGEKLIPPERRISAVSTSQRIADVKRVLGVNGVKPRKVHGRLLGGTERTREMFGSGEDYTPLQIETDLREKGLLGKKTGVSSLLDRLIKQGDVKRISPGVYRATARLLKTVEPTGE